MAAPKLHGVYFDATKRGSRWKAIVSIPGRVQHISLPGTDQYTTQAAAEAQAAATVWTTRGPVDHDDRRREAAARPTICCAPDVCPICWENGGHMPAPAAGA